MEEKIKEIYTEENKNLTELVQEWIDENGSVLYCKLDKEDIKYRCR